MGDLELDLFFNLIGHMDSDRNAHRRYSQSYCQPSKAKGRAAASLEITQRQPGVL
jgi:hypothetical protein